MYTKNTHLELSVRALYWVDIVFVYQVYFGLVKVVGSVSVYKLAP